MGGNTQERKGCWTLDYEGWQKDLKFGSNSAVTSIQLPADIKATAYTTGGTWDNLCGNKDGQNPKTVVATILPGQKKTFEPRTVCGFLFEKA